MSSSNVDEEAVEILHYFPTHRAATIVCDKLETKLILQLSPEVSD